MRKILAPHKEQDGWVYVRMMRVNEPGETIEGFASNGSQYFRVLLEKSRKLLDIAPADDIPESRIISSRRVEEAVETYDFLKLCAEEGLYVHHSPANFQSFGNKGPWCVSSTAIWHKEKFAIGETLRSAYFRFNAAKEAVSHE